MSREVDDCGSRVWSRGEEQAACLMMGAFFQAGDYRRRMDQGFGQGNSFAGRRNCPNQSFHMFKYLSALKRILGCHQKHLKYLLRERKEGRRQRNQCGHIGPRSLEAAQHH